MTIRQPIVTVCGHVDHGKTSILDSLRNTSVQETEKGGITQKISFTSYPAEQLKKTCPLIESSGIKLDIPGFLLIDTPGHAAFTNLRKRGGSLADLAVLVIDINEGIKLQTAEVIQILKHNKTPFLIALNKIDNISGWRTDLKMGLKENIESQAMNIQNTFNERYMTLIGSLNSYGFESDLYYNITDFTKKIALIPCSARTQQGISELIMMLCGLSQKYLVNKLKLGENAKGVILEIKKERSGNYAEAILYDGQLKKSDQIALSNLEGKPLISKIRVLEEIEPLSAKFRPKEIVHASTGLRIQLISSGEKEEILSGMPFEIYKNNLQELKEKFKKQLSESINSLLEKQGVIVKADSLGSLEALLFLLKQNKIPVLKAGIGSIKKTDIASAKANLEINELDAVILGFNVLIDEDAKFLFQEQKEKIKILTNEVIYKLIEDAVEFRKQKAKEIEKERLMELASLFKIKILNQYVFRNTHPAIFGIRVEAGKVKKGLSLIDDKGEKIGRLKNIQHEKKSIDEATEGMEIAVSVPGINFERVLKDKNYLYSDMSESHFRNFKKNKDLLSSSEIKTLQEISEIKRKGNSEWGRSY
ncbi:MAG: translation initiation factor 5B [archaeon GW2011_AR19]|nr:MAG: translation initiation factor 5B [archaeon GW2011_AR19]